MIKRTKSEAKTVVPENLNNFNDPTKKTKYVRQATPIIFEKIYPLSLKSLKIAKVDGRKTIPIAKNAKNHLRI
jgi:hypothetical protein